MKPLVDNAEVVVVGGGVIGAAAALALARAGRKAILLERFAPGHDRGSSHGDGRIFRFSYPEATYLEMARLSGPGWERLGEEAGERLLHLTGNWDGGPAGSPELVALAANFEAGDLRYERLTAAESNARFPQLRLPAGSEALYQGDGGVVLADAAVAALWKMAARHGATTLADEEVVGLDAGDGGVEVFTASGRRVRAGALVLAAGSWSGPLLARLDLDLPLAVSREQVLHFPARDDRVDHRLGAMPTLIDYHSEQPFYGLPQITVPGVKVGWHHGGRPIADPDRPGDGEESREHDAANLAAVRDYVRQRLPHLVPEPMLVKGCLYTSTPDHHFVLDRHPTTPRVVIAAGFSGHGFKFAPVVGEILAALAAGEPPPVDLSLFELARFRRPAG